MAWTDIYGKQDEVEPDALPEPPDFYRASPAVLEAVKIVRPRRVVR